MHAAAGLFASQGFEATTTAQICEAARVSAGNLFHYSPSKRELFAAILTDDGAGETAHALTAALAAEDPLSGLLGFTDHLAAAAAEPIVPGLVLEAMLQAQRDPDLARLLGDDAESEQAGIAALLTRAAAAGVIDTTLDVAQTAAWIMAMIGAVYLHAATSESFDVSRQLPTLRRTVHRLLQP